MTDEQALDLRSALQSVISDQNLSAAELALELRISLDALSTLLNGSGPDFVKAWVSSLELVLEVLGRYGVLADVPDHADSLASTRRNLPVVQEDASEDPFGENAEDIAAEETRYKAELFEWADGVLGLTEAEIELELVSAAKRFKLGVGALRKIVKARRNGRKKGEEARSRPHDAPEDDVRYYGPDFRVSKRGVFARRIDSEGTPFWERISTTRMDIEALTRDARAENWGTYVVITNRDGGMKKLAIPNALTAADKANASDIALTDSTTMGVALVYNGLRLTPDQEILSTEQDYYVTHESIRLAARRTGAKVRRISLYDQIEGITEEQVVDRITQAIAPATRVLALTWVHSSTGLKLPLRAIANAVEGINAGRDEAARVLICVDGVHGFGIEDAALSDLGCDFLMAGCHKWLFGPRGTGIVAGTQRAWESVLPTIPSFIDSGNWQAWSSGTSLAKALGRHRLVR
jgi:hypothetical protein